MSKASDHQSYVPLSIISVLFPLIGIIVGVVFVTKQDETDRKLGEHLIAVSILFTIVWWFLYGWMVSNVAGSL